MDIKRLIESLSSSEKKVIPFLEKYPYFSDLVKNSKLPDIEVHRALQWLESKGVLNIKTKENKIVLLSDKAKNYKELPERILFNNLSEKELTLEEIKNKTNLNYQEINISIGLLKRDNLIEVIKDNKNLKIKIKNTNYEKKSPEEQLFLRIVEHPKFFNGESFTFDKLNDGDIRTFENLKSRGLVNIDTKQERLAILTDLGRQLVKEKIDLDIIEQITPQIIRNHEWKNKKFRIYDIKSEVPTINRGKRHFVDQSIGYIKRIWLDLGFQEMSGDIVQTAFWDLDALFVPQDHPAREMQDTFYLGNKGVMAKGKLPEELSTRIKKVHENGYNTGSKGWGGKWSTEIAKELLLRTHTTVLSAKTLSKLKKEDLPAKFFAVGKVYRNEALDWKHLFEFYQVEGIVVDPYANLRNLLGYLKEFFRKMGYTDVKIKPSFFGYTEPSAEIFAFNPVKRQWVEVGGSGIFRPEVTKPLLGFECPVLAWGLGMERIITNYYGISDLREIYKNDLKQLREAKEFLM
ncbi:phenylalanine--tRNA ligase subunit alpha [Candidatus Woesearchaeota archaeon]|nr:phenylalanine--tRNA ligase subunit alpha [Candidatus Woesearchaeota archaeon]